MPRGPDGHGTASRLRIWDSDGGGALRDDCPSDDGPALHDDDEPALAGASGVGSGWGKVGVKAATARGGVHEYCGGGLWIGPIGG